MNNTNRDGQTIYVDSHGDEYILDENGIKMPPLHTSRAETHSGFTRYDDSQGHCGLCGSLICKGNCFK